MRLHANYSRYFSDSHCQAYFVCKAQSAHIVPCAFVYACASCHCFVAMYYYHSLPSKVGISTSKCDPLTRMRGCLCLLSFIHTSCLYVLLWDMIIFINYSTYVGGLFLTTFINYC